MKIALLGYGKMGREIGDIALRRGHEIVLKASGKDEPALIDAGLRSADVAIEFSTPESACTNIRKSFRADVPVVCGTTGWTDMLEEIKAECMKNGKSFFYASNYSIGVNVFFALNTHLARIMNNYPEYEVKIDETHHVHKKDAPSGTGITLANGILSEVKRKTKWVSGKQTGDSLLQINSYRQAEVPGTHTVSYHSAEDEIVITHQAHNRKGFALGAVLAAEFIAGRKGVFGMKDLMGPF